MGFFIFISRMVLITLLSFGVAGAADPGLPLIQGKKVVAVVNGEPITLREYNQELAFLDTEDAEKNADKDKGADLLRRLINTRLIIQEGKRSGIDELPEIKQRVEVFSKITLREELMEKHVKDIKPDAQEVERLYKESVKEWRISSVLFEKEEAAKRMEEAIKEGEKFVPVLKKLVEDGTAKDSEIGKYLKNRELRPEISGAISKMKIGDTSPMIRLKTGFIIFRLEDIRYPEDTEAREWARKEVLKRKQKDVLVKYDQELKKRYAKVNQKVLDQLDFESKEPGFQNMLKDQRVVAEIKGEKPIKVGELTEYLRQQQYHGVERAVESKRLNKKKVQTLDEMIHKRVFMKEALRLGIDRTESYQIKLKEHEDSLIFGVFVQKAISPEVKLHEKELETYYNEHIKEYTYPEMMKINSLVVKKRKEAEEAIETLRKGVEFKWLIAHAEGQVDKDAEGVVHFEDKPLTVRDLPEDLQKAVSGARAGDFRLYESSKSYFYVLAIQEVIPSRPQPYIEVREEIAKQAYNQKLRKGVEDLADKLRAMSDIKIYLKNN